MPRYRKNSRKRTRATGESGGVRLPGSATASCVQRTSPVPLALPAATRRQAVTHTNGAADSPPAPMRSGTAHEGEFAPVRRSGKGAPHRARFHAGEPASPREPPPHASLRTPDARVPPAMREEIGSGWAARPEPAFPGALAPPRARTRMLFRRRSRGIGGLGRHVDASRHLVFHLDVDALLESLHPWTHLRAPQLALDLALHLLERLG